ncbi:hypothetical protein IBX73_01815 [candidate division WOR-3 bacterium]|nr:hypothetical protein [candidate division WOR-3 bacterium]
MRAKGFAAVELPSVGERTLDRFLLGEDAPDLRDDRARLTVTDLTAAAHEDYFRGRYREGLRNYARALTLDREQVSAWAGQVRILVDVGQYGPAAYWAEKGRDRFTDSIAMTCAHAYALACAGRVAEARDMINVPVSRDETSLDWLLRGEVLLRMKTSFVQRLFAPHKRIGRMGAFFCFVKALASSQNDAFINQRIGIAYLLAADDKRARVHLEASLSLVPDNPLTLYGIAACCRMVRDYEDVLYYVKRAIAGNPELDCAFELLQWLHRPSTKFLRIFSRKKRKEHS